MKENDICNVVAEALGLKPGNVSVNDGTETLREWDSLGFLSILGALENKFGAQVAAIDDLASVKSVKEIIDIFKKEGII
ncbi:MAG: acyl carrier protein [Candidatus Omnitrophica bacterium]|nr:acyl carrier protein [Candidatus Omnitrophota bacterium]MBU0881532.1 acyl carrier protein [Candidatus Omnitrophota bacterium]MBU1808958.1 acyl carrier protein [Candidatus Omnitrophota bacterium]